MTWTDARVALLKKLWANGLSASAIAAQLGISRNAVLGKIDRLGLGGTPRSAQQAKRKPARSTRFFDPTDAVQPDLPPMPDGADITASQRRTLLELDNSVCKWPFGEPQSPDFFFCGAPAASSFPYCVGHCRVAYRF